MANPSPPNHGNRIALMKEHVAPHGGIKRFGDRDVLIGRHTAMASARSFAL
jgi:hypothetical protein